MWGPFDFFPHCSTNILCTPLGDWLTGAHTSNWHMTECHSILAYHLIICQIVQKYYEKIKNIFIFSAEAHLEKAVFVYLSHTQYVNIFAALGLQCWGWNLKCSLECWNSLKLSLNRTTWHYIEPFNSKIITPTLISLLFIVIHKTYKNGRTNTEYIKLLTSSVKHQSSGDKWSNNETDKTLNLLRILRPVVKLEVQI